MKPATTAAPGDRTVAHALELAKEGREAEAAALLEAHVSPAGDDLHRRIATRAAHAALQRHDQSAATAWLERGLARNPADPTLNFFRGNLYLDSDHPAAAAECFRRAVAADPTREEFVCNLGLALTGAGAFAEAIEALTRLPQSASAQLNLGAVHERQRSLVAAAAAYTTATQLQPESFEAWYNLGGVRDKQGDTAAAVSAYNRAVAIRPTAARAHLHRAHSLARLRRIEESALAFERALRLEPGNVSARLGLTNARQRLCDWRGFAELRADLLVPILSHLDERELLEPFFVLALPGVATQAELRRFAANRALRIAKDARPLRAAAAPRRERPLRVGYLSPDFGNHAVAHLVRSLFERHDRRRAHVHGFSTFRHPDSVYRDRLRAGCETWDDLETLSDEAAARQIASREIDVLVDLAGHTKNTRLELLAWRPAPVQVTWLGYPGTTGAPYVDWLLADRTVIPPGEEAAFSERLYFLPGCYLPADDTQEIAAGEQTRAMHGLPATGFVFCAFNNAYKLEPVIFTAWMEILRRVPGSVLWLRGDTPTIEQNLRAEAEARGIAAERLVFDSRGLPKAEHLARHRAADLYLDTHFYNAHTTASDALWSGLPVLTCPGTDFASRVGASLVNTLGLGDELAAADLADYVERAVRFATDPTRLQVVRERLHRARTESPLFDTTAFARKLEDAYEAMVDAYGSS